MRRIFYGVPVLMLACAATLAVPAPASSGDAQPGVIGIAARLAPGDSVLFTATWSAPELGARNLPLDGYAVEWVLNGAVLESRAATAEADSFLVARPPVGDSIGPFSVRVHSRDTAGTLSAPTVSADFWLSTEAEPPPSPGPVEVLPPRVVSNDTVRIFLGERVHICDIMEYTNGGWPHPIPAECTPSPSTEA